ncbi:MAG: HD domain-containing protein [Candidatus Diapherotrites archaeon]|nr:HD domain-containing protein [Candidatus Diapherotrites archaeon]
MEYIRDSVHDEIALNRIECECVDAHEMQRLRGIKQLGMSFLVYPSANHSRFEHSLGTMHIAKVMAKSLKLEKRDVQKLSLAGLLHDLGHGPFSHVSEIVIKQKTGKSHEKITRKRITESRIGKILEKYDFDAAEIACLATGRGEFGKIISGDIDADRMDYLMRDAYHTGVVYGLFDIKRLIRTMRLFRGDIVLSRKGIDAAERLLLARHFMHLSVYRHHTVRIIGEMMVRAINYGFEEDLFSLDEFISMDDVDLLSRLRSSSGNAKEFISRIESRNLFKEASRITEHSTNKQLDKKSPEKIAKIEEKIAAEAGLDALNVILDVQGPVKSPEYNTKVVIERSLFPLDEVSFFAKNLEKAENSFRYTGVYTLPSYKNEVKKIVENMFPAN